MIYRNLNLDEERALYGIKDAEIISCLFAGPKDGESALKECKNIRVKDCFFDLRYPFWHVSGGNIENIKMTQNCRAALWYDKDLQINSSIIGGIKALRECSNISVENCDINSEEFGWFCRNLEIRNSKLISEYPFLHSSDIKISNLNMKGKYSFQYVDNLEINNSVLDTKDAFWHSNNVTVKDSVVKGEYLGWYSANLKFINCKIIGTQPLCYATGLILENCEMLETDLSFEYSDVKADINGSILSVKNPKSGYIKAGSIGKIILDENKAEGSDCKIIYKDAAQCEKCLCSI